MVHQQTLFTFEKGYKENQSFMWFNKCKVWTREKWLENCPNLPSFIDGGTNVWIWDIQASF
jgi:hypothetical protein